MARILVVEDDAGINDLIRMTMDVAGYETTQVFAGDKAVEEVHASDYDLILLDVMLPGLDGFSAFESLQKKAPVIFITARASIPDRVKGLRMGAEDYIVKPFDPMELLARVENVLARHRPEKTLYTAHGVALDTTERSVRKDGAEIPLTPQEFSLLELLMTHPNIAMTREQMLNAAWGYDFMGGSRTVDMHVQKLRKKLGWSEQIQSVYKLGYKLVGDK